MPYVSEKYQSTTDSLACAPQPINKMVLSQYGISVVLIANPDGNIDIIEAPQVVLYYKG